MAVVAAISNGETPLNVLQLLWVNLIMDSLAALGERRGGAAGDWGGIRKMVQAAWALLPCQDWNSLPITASHAALIFRRAALATEAPTPDLLTKRPHGRDEPLISRPMWKFIFSSAAYQVRMAGSA